MLLVSKKTLHLRARKHTRHFLDKSLSLRLKLIDLRHINDVVHILLHDTLIIMEFSFVSSLVESLHVSVQIEVS